MSTQPSSKYGSVSHHPVINYSFKEISSLGANLIDIKARSGKKAPITTSSNSHANGKESDDQNDVNTSKMNMDLEDEDSFSSSVALRKSLIERIPRNSNSQKDSRMHSLSYHSKQDQQSEKEDEGPKKIKAKYLGTSLKLSENQISSLVGLEEAITAVMDTPEGLSWLDLSFNMISSLEGLPKNLPLKSLYLHGNQIQDLKALLPLRSFKELKSLTLHGCPIAEIRNYRFQVLAILPQLKKLDFSGVTPKDLETAKTFVQFFGNRLGK